jgi:hypothetical protein
MAAEPQTGGRVTVSVKKGPGAPLVGRIVFAGLIIATLAAFFISQHLKVTTPFIAGLPHPNPASIDPARGPANCRSTTVSFFLLHHVDDVDVYVVNQSGTTVRSLVRGLFMRKKETRSFTWNGRDSSGRPVAPGSYFFRVFLIHQERTIEIQQPVKVVDSGTCG